jgi:hypothetical protein
MTPTQTATITHRADVDDLIDNIRAFSEEMEQRALNDVSLSISQVFAEIELANELKGYADTLPQFILLPVAR